jgi:molybdate transport system substrate-binding protein
VLVVPTTLIVVAIAACGSSIQPTAGSAPATTLALAGDITVFAAASLTDAFNEIGTAFTKANPAAKVTFSFDASSALAAQIVQGAPADVFASADTVNMDKLTAAGLNGSTPSTFATNSLAIIVPAGNPKAISGVADLAKPGIKVVLCAEQVPCGRYARQVLDNAKVTVTPASAEQNVRGVVTKVTAGEADAGIVYTTDVKAAGSKAASVTIGRDINVIATYPIATVKSSKHPDVSAAFVAFVTATEGQAILARSGFGGSTA